MKYQGGVHQERKLADFLAATASAGDVTPSYAEMATYLGIKSKSRIARLIGQMEVKGMVRRARGRMRSVEVLAGVAGAPGGLTTEEWSWCRANPHLVRAAILAAGTLA